MAAINIQTLPCGRCLRRWEKKFFPAEHISVLELENPRIDELFAAEKRRSTDTEALKLWKVPSGFRFYKTRAAAQKLMPGGRI